LLRALVLGLLVCALAACEVQALQFKNDHRLEFLSPEARSRVTPPFTISWTMRDFTPDGLDGSAEPDAGVFAVFVDDAPMPVGKDLKWLFRSDAGCRRDARCPSVQKLRESGVLLTTETSVTIDVLPTVPDGRGDEQHFINVVLLDGLGVRTQESSWYLPFTTKRRSS
jgi:hypothetical protein